MPSELKYLFYKIAKNYIKYYEEFSYNFSKNGEKRVLDKLSKYNFKTILDVGANTGDWTAIAQKSFPKCSFHLFELSKETFFNLNKRFNNKKNISLNNIALSNIIGNLEYQDFGENSGLNSLVKNANYHLENFQLKSTITTTGDEYCLANNVNHIDFLKIDVEGAENIVLDGFSAMIKKQEVDIIQFEYGYTHGDSHFLMKDFYNLFIENGYTVGPIKKDGVIFMDFDYRLNNFQSGPNFIAVSNKKKNIIRSLEGPKIKGYPK